jgi:starch synthase
MRILEVGAEFFPLIKTGGLGDVMAALPPALARAGAEVRLLLPGYPVLMQALMQPARIAQLGPAFGAATLRVLRGELPGVDLPVYLLDAPLLFDRPGNPYLGGDGRDWPDNPQRFAALGWVAAHLACGDIDRDWNAQIVHSHDWHAGLASAYLALRPPPRPKSLFTVHNLAFAGLFAPALLPELMLPPQTFSPEGLEFHGKGSFMKAGLHYADALSTVSPTYASEIRTPQFGCGFDGLLRHRAAVLHGILNGVDLEVWDPARDPHLTHAYSAIAAGGKARNKATLQATLGLRVDPEALLIGVVTRLTHQKGADLILQALPTIANRGMQVVLLGSGDHAVEQALLALAEQRPDAIAVTIGYDEPFAHRVFGAADVTLVPSRFEPCGLTQLYGLRYGALPVVRRVGGLADTVVDADDAALAQDRATGFVFDGEAEASMRAALKRAAALHRLPQLWQQITRRAMAQHFSWDDAAAGYLKLMGDMVGEAATSR